MVVMTPRQAWTDERLDHFEKRVDERFDHIDAEFARIDKRFDRVEADIRELRQMMERMNAKMTTGFIGLAGLIVSQALFF